MTSFHVLVAESALSWQTRCGSSVSFKPPYGQFITISSGFFYWCVFSVLVSNTITPAFDAETEQL